MIFPALALAHYWVLQMKSELNPASKPLLNRGLFVDLALNQLKDLKMLLLCGASGAEARSNFQLRGAL